MFPNQSENVFAITKVKDTVLWTWVMMIKYKKLLELINRKRTAKSKSKRVQS